MNWPTPSTQFWKESPRLTQMPLDIGRGQLVIPPKDSRPLDIVHFTAELAPIAKVMAWIELIFFFCIPFLFLFSAKRPFLHQKTFPFSPGLRKRTRRQSLCMSSPFVGASCPSICGGVSCPSICCTCWVPAPQLTCFFS